jgi:outer membrane protein assembly factor BamA
MDLLVHEGEILNPQLLFDSERLLWEESNYKNIKFILTPVGETEVDILVLVQDRWGFSIESAVEFNRLKVGLRFSNLFGTPQELKHMWR